MAEPRRVKVEGDYFHGRVPAGSVYVGRAAPGLPRSPYANPWIPGKNVPDVETAVERYRTKLLLDPAFAAAAAQDLAGKNLACWCDGTPCHADELLAVVVALNEPYEGDPA